MVKLRQLCNCVLGMVSGNGKTTLTVYSFNRNAYRENRDRVSPPYLNYTHIILDFSDLIIC